MRWYVLGWVVCVVRRRIDKSAYSILELTASHVVSENLLDNRFVCLLVHLFGLFYSCATYCLGFVVSRFVCLFVCVYLRLVGLLFASAICCSVRVFFLLVALLSWCASSVRLLVLRCAILSSAPAVMIEGPRGDSRLWSSLSRGGGATVILSIEIVMGCPSSTMVTVSGWTRDRGKVTLRTAAT